MDIQKIITEVLEKLTSDETLKNNFMDNPTKVLEKLIGVDLPDEQIDAVIKGIMAKLKVDDLAGKAKGVLGALGGRLDHALANLMLLVRAACKGASAQILDGGVRIIRVDGAYTLEGAKGHTVSLLPLGAAHGVTLEGFFYPLEDHTLTCEHPLGVSNVVTADTASVSVREGDLILFHHLKDV